MEGSRIYSKKYKKNYKRENEHPKRKSASSNSSESDEWIEKTVIPTNREDWMSMTGMIKTYSKDDIKVKQEKASKNHIDSYNPGTSNRELNPYWKGGGSGLPPNSESYRSSRKFIKPTNHDDYYSKSKHTSKEPYESSKKDYYGSKSYNWKIDQKKSTKNIEECDVPKMEINPTHDKVNSKDKVATEKEQSLFLSDEKMNKLAAKIVKAEIIGDTTLVEALKLKLDAARKFRKQNPNTTKEDDDRVILLATNSRGQSRPLIQSFEGDSRSKGGKRKAETHISGERMKYFGNDDKYDLAQMFQNEKYGTTYNDEAELAKIASKHKNHNDDLEDIFIDDISKNRNDAKEKEIEKQKAINQHVKMEKSLEGCEYCVDSKNMLKYLMISCGLKVYLALPSKKSLVKDQCIITTIQHATCVTSVDEDVWEEILNYRKAITNFFNAQNKDVVFYETATKLHRYPHLVINCIPLPRDVGDMAAIYFKKALLECEAEWSMNKKVIELKNKNIRRCVPKGLPYFWIDFGMDPGFAHIIEDQQLFPKSFAEEVIAGILDLDHNLWKNPKREYGDLLRKKVLEFIDEWKPFDIAKK